MNTTHRSRSRKAGRSKWMVRPFTSGVAHGSSAASPSIRSSTRLIDTGVKQEDVAESRLLERHGDSMRVYLKLVRHVIVTVTYDTEHDVQYVRRSPVFATSRSVATKIVETGGADRGFLWRLNSYWRYRQVGNDVQVDVLSLSLSRDIPWVVRPIAGPIITRIGRESMNRTLETVERSAVTRQSIAVRRVRLQPDCDVRRAMNT